MHRLTVIKNNTKTDIYFSGNPKLGDLLQENGIAVFSPCGGTGKCGKCRVLLSGRVSEPNLRELNAGCRLACQAVLFGDATAELICADEEFSKIQTSAKEAQSKGQTEIKQYGIAVDIGTTTVVLNLYNAKGELLGQASAINPQRSVSADVIGRIHAAIQGKAQLLKNQIDECINKLILKVCEEAEICPNDIDRKIITGNTAMLYLFANLSPKSIAVAPFESETLFGEWSADTYLPHCMNAFVGADITCDILAINGYGRSNCYLLCDIGTNGEIALWKNGTLYSTSTAAGPAFEGAEISCGCGSVKGAIDKVWIENGRIKARTIGNERAFGICGSGLVDAIAAFLELGYIDKSGGVNHPLILSANGGNIEITPEDVCAVQLAKAAIAAGIEMVLKHSGTEIGDIGKLYIAGGFGSNLSLENASKIGLIPCPLAEKAEVIGNGALTGAAMMLFDNAEIEKSAKIAQCSQHITLGGSEDFNSAYIKNMMF